MMSALAGHQPLGARRALLTGVLLAAACLLVVTLFAATGSERLAWDFRTAYLPAAEAVLDGESPYEDPSSSAVTEGRAYVYPPQLAFALAPFTVVSPNVAAVLGSLGAILALVGALAVVGVRDPLCYLALIVWAPTWNTLEMANVSALLALGLAFAWRYRARGLPLSLALGLVVSTKLFLWPLLLWTIVTRRVRAAALAIAVGLGVTCASWATLGFAGLTSYPDLVSRLAADDSYSIVGVASQLGLGEPVSRVLMVVAGLFLLLACASSGRHDDYRAFTYSIAASLALTPVVWQHYLVLLAVPLAIARPRFSAIWLLPIILWVSPRSGNGDGLDTILPLIVTVLLVAFMVARSPDGARARAATA
jgi:alpha-1,2-mannosyltransferase